MRIPINWLKEYIDLPEDLKSFTNTMSMIGHLLDKTEMTDTDTVIDLELRGNRADCYAVLGLAREAHASFGGRFEVPTPNHQIPIESMINFSVEIDSPVVKRFYSVLIRNVEVKDSPLWMQTRLRDYGIEPINNLVDITNYVMIETGMPLHVFDLNKMNGNKLILRQAKPDEIFITFDGTELNLTANDCVFGAEDGSVLGLAGIVGGKESGVHSDTTDVLLECAAYDRVAIRKSMFLHKAMTDAGLRHSHDLSASLCDYALQRASSFIMELSGSYSVFAGSDDFYPIKEVEKVIEYNPMEAYRLGGVDIPVEKQIEILNRLEFSTSQKETGLINVQVPLFRTDIFESADIVEEVLRINGYENIPSTKLADAIPERVLLPEYELIEKSKDILVGCGMNEIYSIPMVSETKMNLVNEESIGRAITLVNPTSPEYSVMRTSILTGLLLISSTLMQRGDEEVRVFESGKVFLKKIGDEPNPPHKPGFPYLEYNSLSGVLVKKKADENTFYELKGIVETLLSRLDIQNIRFEKETSERYDLNVKIYQEDLELGEIGIVNSKVQRNLGIKDHIFAFELNIPNLTQSVKTPYSYEQISEYPSVPIDMSAVLKKTSKSSTILEEIRSFSDLIVDVKIMDVFEQENDRSLLFRIDYQAKDRTLTMEEVTKIQFMLENRLRTLFDISIKGREETKIESASVTPEPKISLDKIVIGRILSIENHPNADKLVVCKVDVGNAKPENTLFDNCVQIVTGAENIKPGIAEGKLVPVALVGAVVKSHKTGELMTIKQSLLRGEISEGMLCSKDELGLENDIDGIWILDEIVYAEDIGISVNPYKTVQKDIKTIIFDWSKVCTVEGMSEPLTNFLSEKLGKTKEEINQALKAVGEGYLAGTMSGTDFLKAILEALKLPNNDVKELLPVLSVDSDVNDDVLDYIEDLNKEYNLVLFADCPKEKAEFIVEKYKLNEKFDHLVFSYQLGVVRPDPQFYQKMIEIAGLEPSKSIIIDDRVVNIDAAKPFGFESILFVNINLLKEVLEKNFGIKPL